MLQTSNLWDRYPPALSQWQGNTNRWHLYSPSDRRAQYRTGFSPTQNVVANPQARPAPYFMGNGTRRGVKKTTVFYPVLRVRKSGATYPLRHTPSWLSLGQSYRTTCRHREIRPCHGSARYAPSSLFGIPGPIPDWVTWHLWWKKRKSNRVFLEYLQLSFQYYSTSVHSDIKDAILAYQAA